MAAPSGPRSRVLRAAPLAAGLLIVAQLLTAPIPTSAQQFDLHQLATGIVSCASALDVLCNLSALEQRCTTLYNSLVSATGTSARRLKLAINGLMFSEQGAANYDLVWDLNSIQALLSGERRWLIFENDTEDPAAVRLDTSVGDLILPDGTLNRKGRAARVAMLGAYNSGKTWLLNLIAGTTSQRLLSSDIHRTFGISVKVFHERGIAALDSAGSKTPFNYTQTAVRDRKMTDALLHDVLFDVADRFFFVVNQLTADDQDTLASLWARLNSQDRFRGRVRSHLFVIHNLRDLVSREQVEAVIDHDMRWFPGASRETVPGPTKDMTFWNSANFTHFVFARAHSPGSEGRSFADELNEESVHALIARAITGAEIDRPISAILTDLVDSASKHLNSTYVELFEQQPAESDDDVEVESGERGRGWNWVAEGAARVARSARAFSRYISGSYGPESGSQGDSITAGGPGFKLVLRPNPGNATASGPAPQAHPAGSNAAAAHPKAKQRSAVLGNPLAMTILVHEDDTRISDGDLIRLSDAITFRNGAGVVDTSSSYKPEVSILQTGKDSVEVLILVSEVRNLTCILRAMTGENWCMKVAGNRAAIPGASGLRNYVVNTFRHQSTSFKFTYCGIPFQPNHDSSTMLRSTCATCPTTTAPCSSKLNVTLYRDED